MAGFREAFSHPGGSDTFLLLAACSIVAVHTSVEMFLTTTFPGIALEEYKSFNIFEATIYFLHIVAASVSLRRLFIMTMVGLMGTSRQLSHTYVRAST